MPLFLLQPLLQRIASHIATEIPALFDRLGPHRATRFLIDARGLPFVLLLQPDPVQPLLRAFPRDREPPHEARIAGRYADLLCLIDGSGDGDSLFFSRDLDVSGNIEAVVCLRNALDDVEGSIAARIARMFGPAGRIALAAMRHVRQRQVSQGGENR